MTLRERADPDCELCHGAGFTIHRPPTPPFWESMHYCRCLKPYTVDAAAQIAWGLQYIRNRYMKGASWPSTPPSSPPSTTTR